MICSGPCMKSPHFYWCKDMKEIANELFDESTKSGPPQRIFSEIKKKILSLRGGMLSGETVKSNANSKNSSPISNKGSALKNGQSKPSLDSPSVLSEANRRRAVAQIDNFAKTLLIDIVDVDKHLYNQNLPYHKYYDSHSKKLLSQPEIVKVIEKNHDFFQASPSLFKGSEYRPKDFYFYCTPKRKTDQRITITPKIENRRLKTEGHSSDTNLDKNIALKPYYTKEGRFLTESEGLIRGTPSRSTQAGSCFDTASSSKDVSSRERLTTGTLAKIDEKVILVNYGKDKIPSSLYNGTVRRRKLLSELQQSSDLRSLLSQEEKLPDVRSIKTQNGGQRKLQQQFKGTRISVETSDTNSSLNFLSNPSSRERNGLVTKLRSTVSNNFTMKAL